MQVQILEPDRLTRRSRPFGRRELATRRGGPSINVQDSERLLSVVAGSAAMVLGVLNRSVSGKLATGLGSGLLHRGVTGHCSVYEALGVNTAEHHDKRMHRALGGGREAAPSHFDVLRSVTVQKSLAEVYGAWKQPALLEQAFTHVAAVAAQPSGELRWTLRDPLGHEHTWNMEVVDDRQNERISWGAGPGAPFTKTMTASVRPAPGDRGTELTLQLRIEPPSGVLGSVLKKLFGKAPAWVAERALGNMKSLLEAGELPSLAHNPSARASSTPGAQS
jgi:uncharacterized membrane protein